jgi:hypothetical protein
MFQICKLRSPVIPLMIAVIELCDRWPFCLRTFSLLFDSVTWVSSRTEGQPLHH